MNNSKNLSQHYLVLLGIIVLGTVLRFWHLELKPLWLDEVLTALFSLGHSYNDLPLEVVFSASTLRETFTLKEGTSCRDIAQLLANQSTHPPLFFCLLHSWLGWVGTQSLVWAVRSLPALIGVAAIAAIYLLNRFAFSPVAGLMAAALMAVSPFAVYLSQEARHYTLPILLITLALLALIKIINPLSSRQKPSLILWLSWGVINSIGCYVHYFFILTFVAQLLTLIGIMLWQRSLLPRRSWATLGLVITAVLVSYLPWLPVLLRDAGSSETGWLPEPEGIAPLYQMLLAWLTMVIALPVENQPLFVVVPMALLMIIFGSWVALQTFLGIKQLWQQPKKQLATLTLICFILCLLLQFFAIIYLLGKDITIAPRYSFVFYPAICALLGASLQEDGGDGGDGGEINNFQFSIFNFQFNKTSFFILFISCISSVLVISNLVFIKPFHPEQVAQNMRLEPGVPLVMVMGYKDFQDVALGVSFALAIDQIDSTISQGKATSYFTFLPREEGYQLVWQKLAELSKLPAPPLNLWVVGPGLKRIAYPQQLTIANQNICNIDPSQHYRIGIPYQLYRCR
ncbi:MAG: glycosyltransferase family 39 protein [Coleofasciculaceae cyanobacterium]